MKLATYRPGSSTELRLGIVRDSGELVDIAREAERQNINLPFSGADMTSLIRSGPTATELLRHLEERAGPGVDTKQLELMAPIPRPDKNVFCVGWNYLEHFEEGAAIRPHVKEMPAHPTFFSKVATSIIGPFDEVLFDASISDQYDWEAELAVVMGKAGRNITQADAMSHVFGYTVFNDGSWRDIQRQHGQQWFKGKSLDRSSPMGPWIVTADALDPSDLAISTTVNGVVKQKARTSQMFFKLPRIIEELSKGMTLEPGDIIATGTPSGVGHARTPPEFMKPGDLMETAIEGIGVIRNRVGPFS